MTKRQTVIDLCSRPNGAVNSEVCEALKIGYDAAGKIIAQLIACGKLIGVHWIDQPQHESGARRKRYFVSMPQIIAYKIRNGMATHTDRMMPIPAPGKSGFTINHKRLASVVNAKAQPTNIKPTICATGMDMRYVAEPGHVGGFTREWRRLRARQSEASGHEPTEPR